MDNGTKHLIANLFTNFSEKPTFSDSIYEFSTFEVSLWFVLYFVVASAAVLGNSAICFIVVKWHKLSTSRNLVIFNLALADLLTGLIAIPFRFQAALLQEWHLPAFMCSLIPFIETMSMSVSVLTLTASALIDYYEFFGRKKIKRQLMYQRSVGIVCAIWTFSVICAMPIGYFHRMVSIEFNETQEFDFDMANTMNESDVWNVIGSLSNVAEAVPPDIDHAIMNMSTNTKNMIYQCVPFQVHDTFWWKWYNIYLTIIQYFLPLAIIDYVYGKIAYVIRCASAAHTNRLIRRQNGVKNSKGDAINAAAARRRSSAVAWRQRAQFRVVLMLVMVAVLFTFCWLPFEIYLLLSEIWPEVNDFFYINVVFMTIHCFAMSNSCANPIIYYVYNSKLRGELQQLMLFWRPRPRQSIINGLSPRRRKVAREQRASQTAAVLHSNQVSIQSVTEAQPNRPLSKRHASRRVRISTDSFTESSGPEGVAQGQPQAQAQAPTGRRGLLQIRGHRRSPLRHSAFIRERTYDFIAGALGEMAL